MEEKEARERGNGVGMGRGKEEDAPTTAPATAAPGDNCPQGQLPPDGARGLCVLASPLGPMAHAVPCLLGLTRGW